MSIWACLFSVSFLVQMVHLQISLYRGVSSSELLPWTIFSRVGMLGQRLCSVNFLIYGHLHEFLWDTVTGQNFCVPIWHVLYLKTFVCLFLKKKLWGSMLYCLDFEFYNCIWWDISPSISLSLCFCLCVALGDLPHQLLVQMGKHAIHLRTYQAQLPRLFSLTTYVYSNKIWWIFIV